MKDNKYLNVFILLLRNKLKNNARYIIANCSLKNIPIDAIKTKEINVLFFLLFSKERSKNFEIIKI